MTSQTLASTLEGFLSGSSNAVVIEDGAVVFNLDQAKYSVSGESNKCLLHLWSPERNVVRRVLEVETKGETLRVTVQRMGQVRPTRLDIRRERDPRATSAKRAARLGYQRTLERALKRKFPDLTVGQFSTSMDLENSFGPIYARGLLKRGQSGFAVLGVNRQELQSSIDGALTFGILWLDVCRQAQAGKLVVEGLKLFVPSRCSELVRERVAHLNRAVAKWEVYEFEDRGEEMLRLEISDRGNIATRLTHYCDDSETRARFAEAVGLVRTLMPEVEIGTLSAAEISFRCHGLEFARARLSVKPGDFRGVPEIVFGAGPAERVLDGGNFAHFERLIRSIGEVRHAEGRRKAAGGDCIPSAGWSRWSSRISLRWMISLTQGGGIGRCRRSQPLTAP